MIDKIAIYKIKLMLVFWPRVLIAGKDLVLTGNRGFRLPAARSVPYILVQWLGRKLLYQNCFKHCYNCETIMGVREGKN
jgi:hypothetical protein